MPWKRNLIRFPVARGLRRKRGPRRWQVIRVMVTGIICEWENDASPGIPEKIRPSGQTQRGTAAAVGSGPPAVVGERY